MTRGEKISASLLARSVGLLGLKAMRAASEPGECICCGEPALPKSTKMSATYKRRATGGSDWQDTCGDDICRAAWNKLWRRDARREARR